MNNRLENTPDIYVPTMKWKIRVNDILTPNDKKLKLVCGKHT